MRKRNDLLKKQKPKRKKKRNTKKILKFTYFVLVSAVSVGSIFLVSEQVIDYFQTQTYFATPSPKTIEITSESKIEPQIKKDIFNYISKSISTSQDLYKISKNIQLSWGYEAVKLSMTPLGVLKVFLLNRHAIARVQLDNLLMPLTQKGQIYRPSNEDLTHLPIFSGVIQDYAQNGWTKKHELITSKDEKHLIKQAIKLLRKISSLKLGSNIKSIRHHKHRGFHIELDSGLEIVFGYEPFTAYIRKLERVRKQKADKWQNMKKIELDFQDKIFIGYKN